MIKIQKRTKTSEELDEEAIESPKIKNFKIKLDNKGAKRKEPNNSCEITKDKRIKKV